MNYNFIKLIIKRDKLYNKKKWKLLKFVIIVLAFVFSLISTFTINEINNFNNSFPCHVAVKNTSFEQYESLKNHSNDYNINNIGVFSEIGEITKSKTKLIYTNKIGFEIRKLKIKVGSLPRFYNEIAVYESKDINIGDTIKVNYYDINDNKKITEEFVITAFIKSDLYEEKSILVSEVYAKQILDSQKRNFIYINYNSDQRASIKQSNSQIANYLDLNIKQFYINDRYINGIFSGQLQIFALIIIGIVCILIIRNIIVTISNIFYEERLKYIRNLRLVGATKKDLFAMSNRESIMTFSYSIFGYLIALCILLAYFRFNINIFLTVMCLVFVSVVILSAIISASRKQMNQLLLSYNLTISKRSIIDEVKKNIKTINKTMLSYFDLGFRNIKIYKKKTKLINKSIIISSTAFIVTATIFLSISFQQMLNSSYYYDEDFLIYPKLQNLNQQLIDFQKDNIIDENFIKKIKKIEGIDNVVVDKLIYTNIIDNKENQYSGSIKINNNFLAKKLEKYKIKGEIKGNELIVNKWRMENEGLDFEIGNILTFQSEDEKYRDELIIGGIINNYNSGELLFLPNNNSVEGNANYSISIISSSKDNNSFISSKLDKLLQGYSMLQIKEYDSDFEDAKNTFNGFMVLIQIITGLFLMIAIINLINIISMDLLLRNKEFVLYEINGMTRKQLRNMLFIEYGLIVIKIIPTLFIISYLASYFIQWIAKELMRIGYLDFNYAYYTYFIVIFIVVIIVVTLILKETKRCRTTIFLNSK